MHDDDDDYDPLAEVMRKQRERSRLNYTCTECGFESTDEWLAKHHSCEQVEESSNGYHIDYPACGCEPGDCFGKRYGSDESIKALHYDLMSSGMADYEIDDYYERMNGGY